MNQKFKSAQARDVADYVRNQYGVGPEFLWARSPDDAIWRRPDNGKWFAGVFHVRHNRIEPTASDARVEILNLRCNPDMIGVVVDGKQIFPGWHMNKRHWITIPLTGRMNMRQIESLIDNSFGLAYKK